MPLQKIALIGANGRLGPSILSNLLKDPSFTVTVLNRASSKSQYPSNVNVVTIPDDASVSDLTSALRGQDALVVTTNATNSTLQIRFADAAYRAGIRRIIPADFGSVDASNPRARALVPLYDAKQAVQQHVASLSDQNPAFTWTTLVCGHFFDYGLQTGLLSIHIPERKARLYDGGDVRFSATTLDTIGKATAAILRHDDATRNKKLYVHSVCTTQNQILDILKRLTPAGEEWHVENKDSKEWLDELKRELDAHPGDAEAAENLVGVVGLVETCWEGKEEFANDLLLDGKEEDLEGIVKRVFEEMKK